MTAYSFIVEYASLLLYCTHLNVQPDHINHMPQTMLPLGMQILNVMKSVSHTNNT